MLSFVVAACCVVSMLCGWGDVAPSTCVTEVLFGHIIVVDNIEPNYFIGHGLMSMQLSNLPCQPLIRKKRERV